MNKRPISVTIIAWLYIAVGVIGFAYHLGDFKARNPFPYDALCVEVLELIAIVSGVYMLRGRNWARWLALAWMAAHVVLSFFNSLSQAVVHSLFFVILAYFLCRPAAIRCFRTPST